MIRQMRVAVIGQGYVGLTISVGALSAGHEIVGIDLSASVIESLKSGKSHIEGISDQEVSEVIKSGQYRPTTKYEDVVGCEVVIIAVPTPLNVAGKPDLALLESAADLLGKVLKTPVLIINESTSHPGTLQDVIKKRIEAGSPLDHGYAISPERVDPGNSKFGTRNTPRIVGGLTDQARDEAVDFYRTFCDDVVPVSSAEVAEAAKLLENTFRFINIGLVNEFAQIMGAMNIPVDEVLKAAATKPYGFMPFHPNVGIGGHCIPVDPIYLQAKANELGLESRYISLSEQINHEMPEFVIKRLKEEFGSISGKKILVIGVSYKADIADTRETPAERVVEILKREGAKVSWHDPIVTKWNGSESSSVGDAFDLGLVLVKHSSLNLNGWGRAPLFTVNSISAHPEWIPLLSVRPKK
jgi:UDP-N-acetyl-D-glucosamine dehydrogenase